ncbi:MFS transporter [Streptomyces sp. NPDC018029]|uniref:MFS transporter n=1 Tax=Streptomyces sp. NPDC018029 TaxID=3365032 RepID=UPI00379C5286
MPENKPHRTLTDAASRRRWAALIVVLGASSMDAVDVTVVHIAVPDVQADTGASTAQLQWITGGDALTFALGLITGGRLGDLYGRKKIFLPGVAGSTLTLLMCGVAGNPETLLAWRVAQGATAALMVPQVLSIVHVTFPGHERGKVFGIHGSVMALGTLAGPLAGALLVEGDLFGLGWRPIFLVNLLPLAAAMMAGAGLSMQIPVPRFGRRVGAAGRRTAGRRGHGSVHRSPVITAPTSPCGSPRCHTRAPPQA